MVDVTINGTVYSIPDNNDNPAWGEELHDLLVALAAGVNATSTAGDIATTSFSVPNVAATVSVTGVSFDTTTIRSAILSYSIYRTTATTETSEAGNIYITYKSTAGSWELSQTHVGDGQVTFTITAAGQLQILPAVLSGGSYTGTLKINAKVFTQ